MGDETRTLSVEDQLKILQNENIRLGEENQILTECLLEMSQIVYGGGA